MNLFVKSSKTISSNILISKLKKHLYLLLGHLCLVLGVIGMMLPLIPTTPFLLLAAFLYSRANSRLHHWVLNHRYLGPPVRDWEHHGVIGIKAKIVASIMLGLVIFLRIPTLKIEIAFKILVIVILIAVLIFIWTRPSHIKK